MKCKYGTSFLVLAMFTVPLVAQHFPSNEDLRHTRVISSPVLSPDLKHVVAVVQESTADGGGSHLWLLNTDGSAPRQLTFGEPAPAAEPGGGAAAGGRRGGGMGERSAE